MDREKLFEIFPVLRKMLERQTPTDDSIRCTRLEDTVYSMVIPSERKEAYTLSFKESYKIRKPFEDLKGYTYTLNGRKYTDVSSFCERVLEELPQDVDIREDIYGEKCLSTYTSIPTFDSSDREWNSRVMDFLVYDGKNVHLIIMSGGYKMASLTFYKKLLSADKAMQPIFKKLGWPMKQIQWNEETKV